MCINLVAAVKMLVKYWNWLKKNLFCIVLVYDKRKCDVFAVFPVVCRWVHTNKGCIFINATKCRLGLSIFPSANGPYKAHAKTPSFFK